MLASSYVTNALPSRTNTTRRNLTGLYLGIVSPESKVQGHLTTKPTTRTHPFALTIIDKNVILLNIQKRDYQERLLSGNNLMVNICFYSGVGDTYR